MPKVSPSARSAPAAAASPWRPPGRADPKCVDEGFPGSRERLLPDDGRMTSGNGPPAQGPRHLGAVRRSRRPPLESITDLTEQDLAGLVVGQRVQLLAQLEHEC